MRKLIAGSKGFSSVIGTVFMVLVMMLLCTTVFMWTLRQNTLYYQAVKEKNQIEVDRLNERVKAFNANYAVEDADVSVTVELQNQGPLSVQILNLWVVDVNTGNYNFSKSLSVNYLQPGGNATLAATVTIMGSASEHRFSSWLITGRGNVVPLQPPALSSTQVQSMITQGIGSVQMYFKNFTWYSNLEDGKPIGNGSNNYTVPSDQQLMFGVLLTNLDPTGQDINLTSSSFIWVPCMHSNNMKWDAWNIANVTNGIYYAGFNLSSAYITLKNTVPTWVYFGPTKPFWTAGLGPLPINIALFGRLGTSDYGQNLPYAVVNFS